MKERYKIIYQAARARLWRRSLALSRRSARWNRKKRRRHLLRKSRRNIGMRDIIVRHLRSEKITRWRAAATTANRRRRRDARCWIVLLGRELHNVCAVVTRYFGGTLLGTGGLVRAYGGAVQEGLKNCVVLENAWLANGRSGQTTAGLERYSTFWQKQSCRFWTASTARVWI